MTNAPGGPGAHPGTDSFFDSLRRLDLRRAPDGWVGGVSSGLAQRLGLDPLVIRAAFVVAAVFFGFGIALYLWAWLLVPDQHDRTHLEQGLRDGRGESILMLAVTVIATIGVMPWWGGANWFWGEAWWFVSALITVAFVVGVIYLLRSSFRDRPGDGQVAGSTAPPPPPGGGDTWSQGTGRTGQAGTTSSGWSGSTASTWPAPTPSRPDRPAAPHRPIRERRRTGGPVAGLISTGLLLLTIGGLLWAGAELDLPGNDLVVALAGGLAVLGLVVAVLGATGRHSGWPGFLAGVLLVGTVVVAPLPEDYHVSTRVGQDTWTPTTVNGDTSFSLGAGEGVLDLGRLDPAELSGQTLTVDVNVGQLRVLVPGDLTVRVDAGTGIGTVNLNGIDPTADGGMSLTGGLNVMEDLVVGEGPVDLVVDAQVGIGQLSVERN